MAGASGSKRTEERTAFGYREVPLADKQGLVDGIFDRAAARYDLMNDLMSAGLHRIWKGDLVAMLGLPRRGHARTRLLDVAGGTGDIAFRVAARSPLVEITLLDISPAMLAIGRKRAAARGLDGTIRFVEGNAESLPFSAGSFDLVTIAFGMRNVPRIDVALAEAFRVLARGGRLLVLEFTAVDVAGLDQLYDLYSFQVIPRLGAIVAGDEEPYRYLVESIRKFPAQDRFADMIKTAGFGRVTYRNLSGGIAAIHSGWKI